MLLQFYTHLAYSFMITYGVHVALHVFLLVPSFIAYY